MVMHYKGAGTGVSPDSIQQLDLPPPDLAPLDLGGPPSDLAPPAGLSPPAPPQQP